MHSSAAKDLGAACNEGPKPCGFSRSDDQSLPPKHAADLRLDLTFVLQLFKWVSIDNQIALCDQINEQYWNCRE